MNMRSSTLALPTAAPLVLFAGSAMNNHAIDKPGGTATHGGDARDFSRTDPAASGSFADQRGAAATPRARQVGATERSGQRPETQKSSVQSQADTRSSGQQEVSYFIVAPPPGY